MAKEKRLDVIIGARDQASPVLGRVGQGVQRYVAGIVAGAALLQSVRQGIRATIEDMRRVSQETLAFEAEITPLLSLGENVRNIQGLRDQVIQYSNAWGIARGEIASAMFNLQSGTANLSETTRRELLRAGVELTKVFGVDLPVAMNNIIKLYQIYGDEAENVAEIQSKIAFLADEGFLTFEDMASQLPQVAAAAKALGISLDEVIAGLIVALQRGGEASVTFTGFRNVLLRMNNAAREGITLTGDMTDKIRQLAALGPEQLQNIFGDRAFAVIANVIEGVDQIEKILGRIGTDVPDVADKFATRMEDAVSATAEIQKMMEQMATNQMVGLNLETQQFTQMMDAARQEADQRVRTGGRTGMIARGMGGGFTLTLLAAERLAIARFEKLANEALQAGEFQIAELLAERIRELRDAGLFNRLDSEAIAERIMRTTEIMRRVQERESREEAARQRIINQSLSEQIGYERQQQEQEDMIAHMRDQSLEESDRLAERMEESAKLERDINKALDAANRSMLEFAAGFDDIEAKIELAQLRIKDTITQRIEQLEEAIAEDLLPFSLVQEARDQIRQMQNALPEMMERVADRIREDEIGGRDDPDGMDITPGPLSGVDLTNRMRGLIETGDMRQTIEEKQLREQEKITKQQEKANEALRDIAEVLRERRSRGAGYNLRLF